MTLVGQYPEVVLRYVVFVSHEHECAVMMMMVIMMMMMMSMIDVCQVFRMLFTFFWLFRSCEMPRSDLSKRPTL